MTPRKRPRYMYLDVSDMYPKMYLGLVWDTCKIHAKYQDTCILLECNRAFKIHLRYIRIHEGYMYPSGYTQDTSRYIRIRILITNPPKLDNKPPRSPSLGPARSLAIQSYQSFREMLNMLQASFFSLILDQHSAQPHVIMVVPYCEHNVHTRA